ncbi:BRCT domain-containing protein [Citricoccus parietis]
MEIDPEREDWNAPSTQTAARVRGESAPTAFIAPVLRGAPDGNREHFLERIVIRLPEFTGPSEHDEYLALVDRALVDRYLSAHEEEQLITTANEIGISRRQASELHRQYFEELVHAAWRDGVLTDLEIADLQLVASMLDIPAEAVDQARTPRDSQASANPAMATPLLGPGDKVVLTGDMSVPRSSIEDRLRAQGYVPHPGVTKAVKLVVAADPDSISGKARKARDYGIPVVGEDYLWKSVLTS